MRLGLFQYHHSMFYCFQGVESDRVPSFTRAMEHGSPITVDGKSTLADGLAVPRVGCNAFATAASLVDKMVSTRYSNRLSLTG